MIRMAAPWRATVPAGALAVALLLAAPGFGGSAAWAAANSKPPADVPSELELGDPAGEDDGPEKSATFGEEVTLKPRIIVSIKGKADWNNAFEALVDAFKSLYAYVDKNAIPRDGLAMAIYTDANDMSFVFQAALPIAEKPKTLPAGDIAISQSPGGRAFRFVHEGSYESMDITYEAIANFLDDRKLEARDIFIEEYQTDPVATPDDHLVVHVYVPVK